VEEWLHAFDTITCNRRRTKVTQNTSITRLLEYQMHTMMMDSSFQTKVVAAYIPFGVVPPEASIKYEILVRDDAAGDRVKITMKESK
jgi:hypothetical protein